jgi:hypothetical protein
MWRGAVMTTTLRRSRLQREERRFEDALWLVAVSGIGRAFSDASPNTQTILERRLSDALAGC